MRSTEVTLKHPGTGRSALVLRTSAFWECQPPAHLQRQYVLVIASNKAAQHSKIETARAWIDAGACYVCAWGPNAEEIEETFDYASFMPELGEPLPFTLMTTSHRNEPVEEALWFAFYNGKAPTEEEGTVPVVVVVDSEVLEQQCIAWVQENVA